MDVSKEDSKRAKQTLMFLACLNIHPTLAELIGDAQKEQRRGEPFLYGLQRVENMYIELFVSDRWTVNDAFPTTGQTFAPVSPFRKTASQITSHVVYTTFVDPAQPRRYIFERYTRDDDALLHFLQFDSLLRAAQNIGDLDRARGTHMWPTVERVLQGRARGGK